MTTLDLMCEVRQQLRDARNSLRDNDLNALIITGEALIYGLTDDESNKVISDEIAKLIIEISEKSNAVLACRVSPKQK